MGQPACPLGIIPARAGFTVRSSRSGRAAWDHPRSRGVYILLSCGWASRQGSSPLARGLPRRGLPNRGLPRIIPARAGFTPNQPSRANPDGDHPRSRGVYRLHDVLVAIVNGSSPLARGLRDWAGPLSGGRGIIPARAGFTVSGDLPAHVLRDHPRSRGVYDGGFRRGDVVLGSSPLARGLRLRILGIPTNPYSTRPLLPSLPT